LIVGFFFLPFWPWIHEAWWIYAVFACVFIAVLTFLVSIFGKWGSVIWRGKGQR
jgi:hypothetical protein